MTAARAMHHGAPTRARESRQPVVVSSRWRCREHPDQAVTRRGAGCLLCEAGRTAIAPPGVTVTVDTGAPAHVAVAFVAADHGQPIVRVRYRPDREHPWSCDIDGDTVHPACSHTQAARHALEAAAIRRGLTNDPSERRTS